MTYILLRNNTIQGAGGGGSEDNKVSISGADDTTDYLENKLTAGTFISITKQNTGAVENLRLAVTGADSTVTTYTPADNSKWNSSADPGDVNDALDQLADRVKTLETSGGPSPDASAVTYTPGVLSNWTSSTDPGDVDNALDQLASRTKALEITPPDASVIPYSPSTLGNWNSSSDPGEVDDALNQLAARTKSLESSGVAPTVAISSLDTTPDYLQSKIIAGSRITLTKQNSGANENILITASIQDASVVTYTPADNTDWNSSTDPGNANGALDQLADRVKFIETSFGGSPDASAVTYDPNSPTDWIGSTDPGNVDDALDQLGSRVYALENPDPIDASDITYTPSDENDWAGDTDPGGLQDALDQLADRVASVEGGGGGGAATMCGVKVTTLGSPQEIFDATVTTLVWDDEVFDTDSFHDSGTNPERITIPVSKSGYYQVGYNFRVVAGTLTPPHHVFAMLMLNEFTEVMTTYTFEPSLVFSGEPQGGVWNFNGSTILALSDGDFLTVVVQNDNNDNDSHFGDTGGPVFFWAYLVGV